MLSEFERTAEALLRTQPFFNRFAKNVQQKHMRFLNSGGRFTADDQLDVSGAADGAAIAPKKCNSR